MKRRRPVQRTLNVRPSTLHPSEQEYLNKDAAAKFLRQAEDHGKGRRRKRRPRRQSRRQHQSVIDRARFAAEMESYHRAGKPEPKGES